jgi:hypothetical protein
MLHAEDIVVPTEQRSQLFRGLFDGHGITSTLSVA